jgi:hypothetical protein
MLNPYRFDPKFKKFFTTKLYVSIKNVKMYWFSYQVFFHCSVAITSRY